MLTTIQFFALASSSALSSFPTDDLRSQANSRSGPWSNQRTATLKVTLFTASELSPKGRR